MNTEKKHTAMPAVAGSLAIAAAGLKLLAMLGILGASFFFAMPASAYPATPMAILLIIGIISLALVVLGIVGGIHAIQRKRWGLALTGSIAAFLPFSLLGIASIILVALSKDEFE